MSTRQTNPQHTAERVPAAGSRAFTLIELLVALAAVALLALGIAEIFKVTGKTVAAGRRLSNLTNYASLLERQFRSDFSSMTRDGFLLIRNYGADANSTGRWDRDILQQGGLRIGADRVRLAPSDETAGRTRRTDSIMFFANGSFSSVRDPRHPDRVARSSAASIYYGHGLYQTPGARNYLFPRADDQFASRNDDDTLQSWGRPSSIAGPNPNQFASNWMLLRQVTLLCPPSSAAEDGLRTPLPTGQFSDPVRWPDNALQHALQPAAPSIFRKMVSLMEQDSANLPPAGTLMRLAPTSRSGSAVEVPRVSSGIVDIASTDLSEIRGVVLGAVDPRTAVVADLSFRYPFATIRQPTATPAPAFTTSADGIDAFTAQNIDRMQRWMMQAMPADLDGSDRTGVPDPNLVSGVRCEVSPPNYLGLPNPTGQLDFQRVDQTALSASNFAPRCTEFIVEWSFGQTAPGGRLIWYGMNREVDVNDNGNLDLPPAANGIDYIIGPYGGGFQQSVRLKDGSVKSAPVSPALIHPARPFGTGEAPLYSCFGYIDPTYAPSTLANSILFDSAPRPGPGGQTVRSFKAADGDVLNAPDTIPWAWPTLIRITMSLADPADPLVERTFQFVLPAAGNRAGAAF